MKKESVLNKEFKPKEVSRLRNLITKNYDNKTVQGIGYDKTQEFHNEGDIWEENGRTWTIKNSIKQNVTKLDEAKKSLKLPLFCPECSSKMKPHLDRPFYIMYNRCFNCQVDFESELKRQGLLEDYEKFVNNSHIDGLIKDYESFVDEMINNPESFITEQGDQENWTSGNKNIILQNKNKTIEYLKSFKK